MGESGICGTMSALSAQPDYKSAEQVPLLKGKFVFFFLNLDLITDIKYVQLLTDNSLVKVSVLRKIFRFLEIRGGRRCSTARSLR